MASIFTLADVGALFNGFGINVYAFLSQLISFGIVFFILSKWFFPIIIRTLDKRQATIREGVENAERAKQELSEAKVQADQIILEARKQGQDIIAQASKAAEREASRLEEEARTRLSHMEQQQEARIQQEVARARAELGRLVVNLSIDAAGKVISKSVDSKDNRRLVEEFVSASQAKES